MNKFRGKLLQIMLFGILVPTMLVGGISVLGLWRILKLDSEAMLVHSAQEFAAIVSARRDRLILFIALATLAVCVTATTIITGIFRRAFEMAYTDELTKVASQNAFHEELAERDWDIHRGRASFGLCIFDVNHLKAVNDYYGHSAGDHLLMQATALIRQYFPDEKIYRIGGDEFAIIFRNYPRFLAYAMMREFRKCMRDNISQDIRTPVIASGLAHYDKNTDAAFQDVFARADQAMYKEKLALKALDPAAVQEQTRNRL